MSFADKAQKIADMHDWEREHYEWLKKPIWERMDADGGHGIDGDGMYEDAPKPVPTTAELEVLVGHKLIDLDKEGLPY